MMAATHRLVGGSTAFVAGASVGFPMAVVACVSVVAAASSTLPDDIERPLRIKHRQITHYPLVQISFVSLLALAIISSSPIPTEAVLYLAGSVALALVMHSAADAMTVDRRGIALLWPIRRRGYHLLPRSLRARVGSKSVSEITFGAVWIAFVLCFTYARFRHSIPA